MANLKNYNMVSKQNIFSCWLPFFSTQLLLEAITLLDWWLFMAFTASCGSHGWHMTGPMACCTFGNESAGQSCEATPNSCMLDWHTWWPSGAGHSLAGIPPLAWIPSSWPDPSWHPSPPWSSWIGQWTLEPSWPSWSSWPSWQLSLPWWPAWSSWSPAWSSCWQAWPKAWQSRCWNSRWGLDSKLWKLEMLRQM